MAQRIPLPPTVSCFVKTQIGFTFLVPAHPGSPGQRAVKRVCVQGSRKTSARWQTAQLCYHYVSAWVFASLRKCVTAHILHWKCLFTVTDVGFGATATGTGIFGQQQPPQQSTGTSLFGNTAFGAAKPMFGAATTTASTPFGGLSTAGAAGTSLFGQANQNKVYSCISHCNDKY